MLVSSGRSEAANGATAVAEATRDWQAAPDIIFAFASTRQDAGEVAAALEARFPGVPVAGCTTSGEHLGGEHHNGTLVLAGLVSSGIRWAVARIEGLGALDEAGARRTAAGLFAKVGASPAELDPSRFFGLLFIDGLSALEERVASLLADALEGVRMAGGSAGDDLKFQRTAVLHGGEAVSGAAVLVLGRCEETEVRILKHQHFVTTPRTLVITRADTATRTVHEINGYPAREAYAAALGLQPDELTAKVTFLHPITFVHNGEIYVRSIQRLNADGSITFYCAIEPGMVLQVGGHGEMCSSLVRELAGGEPADFLLGFNCILRALEAEELGAHERLGEALRGASRASVGFDTYGEQLDGLHINQTLVAVLFRRRDSGGQRHAA